ncbi:MAG: cobalt-precorrin-5B (C(1))-methyltransferase CbiD [Eubacteriales bacterium]|nr:cobalt-precorrin-5B (C(1))-methyltransferase CbiD [Eubacteriales bacterium]
MEQGTGLEEAFVIRGNKKMRMGYTTGSCAAAACKGAAEMLLGGKEISQVPLMTPKGILLRLRLLDIRREGEEVSCAVKKDGGDDPDNTHGLLVYARVKKRTKPGIRLDGGPGVGRVTKAGLSQKIGEAAINPVPKAMILRAAEETAAKYDYEGGLDILIFVPGGEERAKKTFNPRLGIVGGISILGTTGIVEPMSEKSLVASIQLEMRQHFVQGESYILMTPGNYGEAYLREHMELPFERNVQCSNYVGESIDMAVEMGVKGLLFVSHIGKFVKVAAGIMNTHSHCADGRMEILAANAIRAGGDLACARDILGCSTTDEALAVLERGGILRETMGEVLERIQFYLDHRSYERILLGAVIFSNVYGFLGQTARAGELMEKISRQSIEKNLCIRDRKG